MATPTTATEFLKVHRDELVKQYIELDGQGRSWKVYRAPAHTADGGACLVTEYAYSNPTSTTIIKRKEYYGTWVSATMEI